MYVGKTNKKRKSVKLVYVALTNQTVIHFVIKYV